MMFDYRYLRKHFGWPEIPRPAWQKIKRFALNPFCVGGCRVYFTAFMTVGDAV